MVPLFALLLALAGCVGDAPDPVPVEAEEDPADVTAELGAIRGTVATTLYEPLESARVELLDAEREPLGRSELTAADGAFLFRLIAPGEYVIVAMRPGLVSQLRGVTVEPGVVAEASFRLEPDRTVDPHVIEMDVVGLHTYGYRWHVEEPGTGCTTVGDVPTCGSRNPFNSDNWHKRFTADDSTSTILLELVWSPSLPESGYLWMDLYCEEVDHIGLNTNMYFGQVSDPEHECYFPPSRQTSPSVIRVDSEHWEEHGYAFESWEWRVVPGYGTLGTQDSLGIDAGVIYQQAYSLYLSVFQNGPAPEGYSRLLEA